MLLLLSPKIISIKNSINFKIFMKRLPFILIGLLFWFVFFVGSYEIINFIRGIRFLGEIFSRKLLALAFFSIGIFLLLSNIITALSSFYLSKDLPFLMSKPIKIKEILRLKAIETIVSSSWMMISFMPPFFIAYGVCYGANPYFYILLILTLIPFLLIQGGVGILIAHILAKIFPVKRLRLAMLAIGLLLFLSIYFLVKTQWSVNPATPGSFIHAFLAIKTDSPLLPNFWMTESVMALLKRQSPDTLYLLLLWSNGLFMLILAGVIGKRLFVNNLERIQPSIRKGISKTRDRFYPGRNPALLWKDIKVFFRDTGQWSQIFIIMALIIIYVYNFRTIPLSNLSEFTFFIKEIMVLINMVMAGLVLTAVSARFLYSSISLEGMTFWIVKTSPLTVKRVIWSKFLFGFIPVTVIMSATVFITNKNMGVDNPLMTLSVVTVLILCISISGLGTGMGAIYPKFKYENIASVSMGPGGMLFMLIAFSIILLTISVEAWAFYLYKRAIMSGMSSGFKGRYLLTLAGLFVLVLNGLAFYIPMKIGKERLEKDLSI